MLELRPGGHLRQDRPDGSAWLVNEAVTSATAAVADVQDRPDGSAWLVPLRVRVGSAAAGSLVQRRLAQGYANCRPAAPPLQT